MNWAEFEAAVPSLAALGRERFERMNVLLLGTLRADGSPRISPVNPYFVGGELIFGVMRSKKGSDLLRDPRCVLHSAVRDGDGTDGEFKLFGRAKLVTDPHVRDADSSAWWRSYAPEAANVFAIDIDSAAFLGWDFAAMVMNVINWSPAKGLKERSAPYP